MIWLLLVLAIASEVTATLSLRASEGLRRRRWIPVIVVGYLAAFSLLGTILAMGMPVGVAYGIWAAAGVAITAVMGRILFKDHFSAMMAAGVALIAVGVALIEFGH
ncbi:MULTISPECIES: DMT family transporter [Microbacterium]|uniref:QacE family quaternary ammonium compound efflux SMR transporter n=1 Tax=Microbacterium galbinum TaxID=2851646 RepID=A0ABY4IQG6_9MICO|nr:SMR family transporter [Microbacterium galbinum]MCK2022383.1 QacE family quaternary ammonium compound efflux SMR transporter [Microbacterium galbinum]UPL15046.1 QacE family quaternary ammonium compound efflux SMR transporter [Microbacterium galbinum]